MGDTITTVIRGKIEVYTGAAILLIRGLRILKTAAEPFLPFSGDINLRGKEGVVLLKASR